MAGYKSFSRTVATNGNPLNSFRLRMGTLQLNTHEGIRPDYTFTNGKKTFKKIPGDKFDPKKIEQVSKLKIN